MEHNAKQRILNTAVDMAAVSGWRNLKRDNIAKEAACATGLVNAYYNNMDDLRTEVLRVAIERNVHSIMLEGLAHKHPLAVGLPPDIKIDLVMR